MPRGPALDLAAQIDRRITAQPGSVWTPIDFLDLGSRANNCDHGRATAADSSRQSANCLPDSRAQPVVLGGAPGDESCAGTVLATGSHGLRQGTDPPPSSCDSKGPRSRTIDPSRPA